MSDPQPVIRPAREEDVDEISRLICTTLFRSNAADYPQVVLERVAEVNAPARILANLTRRDMLVALSDGGTIIGTAAAEGKWIKSFFVHPDWQEQGVGQEMLRRLLKRMKAGEIWLQSSLTAIEFYRAAGFVPMREIIDGEDRTLLMRLTTEMAQPG